MELYRELRRVEAKQGKFLKGPFSASEKLPKKFFGSRVEPRKFLRPYVI